MFSAIQPLDVDPETMNQINGVALAAYIGIFVVAIAAVIWKVTPIIYRERQKNRLAKLEAANAIWFDHAESELHCGLSKIRIEPKSFEHFVCKITFSKPDKYHTDLDIFDEAERAKGAKETNRGVEQAVRRLNKKAKTLGLKDNLFKRSKERTSVNDDYRERIAQN